MAKRSISRVFIIAILSIILWVSMVYRVVWLSSLYECLDTAALYSAYGMMWVQSKTIDPIVSWYEAFHQRKEMAQKLSDIEYAYIQLQAENVALKATADYYQDIKELREFAQRYALDHARYASVIERYITNQTHYILVDAGSVAGIEQDMIAVYGNQLIGRVEKVFPWYSKIILITDPLCKVGAYCCATKTQGIHQGRCNVQATELHRVSHLQELEIGDLVISSGEGIVFPRGFALGKIQQFNQNNLVYDVVVEPLLDVTQIPHCLLIKKGEYDLTVQREASDNVVQELNRPMKPANETA